MDVTEVYNLHLKTVKRFKKKPHTLRKDFSKFKTEKSYSAYSSVTRFLNYKSDAINPVLFFEATAFYHSENEWVSIGEYNKPSALANYTQYKKHLERQKLESRTSRIIPSVKFIKSFCQSVDIEISEYLDFTVDKVSKPEYLNHIKKKDIDIYTLFIFENFLKKIQHLALDSEVYNFYFDDNLTPFEILKKYNTSDIYRKNIKKVQSKIFSNTKRGADKTKK